MMINLQEDKKKRHQESRLRAKDHDQTSRTQKLQIKNQLLEPKEKFVNWCFVPLYHQDPRLS